MMKVTGAALTHAGQIRKTNQDRAHYSPLVGAVADGMGGHQGGEQAAAITIEIFGAVDDQLSKDGLIDTVRQANRAVFDESERPELRGMGTTIVAAVLHPEQRRITMVNVGDSRGYRLRDGELEQVTVDHSLVEELVRQGRISEEDARFHPQRNIVTRALGLSSEIEIDVFDLDAQHGDRLLLCSDGLFNEVTVDVIAERLRTLDDPEQAAEQLVELAVAGGGRDNISVVLLDITDDGDPEAIRSATETAVRPTPKAAATALATTVIEESDQAGAEGGQAKFDIPPAPSSLDRQTDRARSATSVFDEIVEPSMAAPFEDRERTEEHPPVDLSVSDEVLHVERAFLDADDTADPQIVDSDRSRARWVAIAVVATFLVAFLGINWFASSAYFAAADAGEVVIFKGRPGGILWIDPEVEQRTGVGVDELAPAGVQKLEQELEWTSIDDAVEFVDQLDRAEPPGADEPDN